MVASMKPASFGGRVAFWWCRIMAATLPEERAARVREERLSHLLDAEESGVPGYRLVAATLVGAFDDFRSVLSAGRRRNGLSLVGSDARPEAAVFVASVLVGVAYIASLAARYPMPRAIKAAAESGALAVLLCQFPLVVRRLRRSRPLDDRTLSSYNVAAVGTDSTERGGAMFEHPKRAYLVLGTALVVLFVVSGVGQLSSHHDAWYWLGAFAWVGFGLVLVAIVVLSAAVGIRKRRRLSQG
jgi:hypothetical protein